jgi:hypothetical protein
VPAGGCRGWELLAELFQGFDLVFRQNEMVVEAIVGTVATFARGGYDVVVDGIVGPWFLPPFRAAAEHDHLAMSYVVLRPDLDTTLSRAKERVGELKDRPARRIRTARRSRGPRDRHRGS